MRWKQPGPSIPGEATPLSPGLSFPLAQLLPVRADWQAVGCQGLPERGQIKQPGAAAPEQRKVCRSARRKSGRGWWVHAQAPPPLSWEPSTDLPGSNLLLLLLVPGRH